MKAINQAGNLKRICRHERRRTRQVEATARNLAWNALTTAAKLRILDSRPGKSNRQRKRLEVLK